MGLIGTMIQTHNGGNMSPNEIKKLQYKRLKKIVEYAKKIVHILKNYIKMLAMILV